MAEAIGNQVRGVTRATRGAAAAGSGATGAAMTLVTYALVRTGLEPDPGTAVLLGGSLITLAVVGATWAAATFAGKRTPSDPAVPLTLERESAPAYPTVGAFDSAKLAAGIAVGDLVTDPKTTDEQPLSDGVPVFDVIRTSPALEPVSEPESGADGLVHVDLDGGKHRAE